MLMLQWAQCALHNVACHSELNSSECRKWEFVRIMNYCQLIAVFIRVPEKVHEIKVGLCASDVELLSTKGIESEYRFELCACRDFAMTWASVCVKAGQSVVFYVLQISFIWPTVLLP